jgi:hypothetical protein
VIRAKLTEFEQRLDHGLSLNEAGELQRMPADLDRAITLRQAHWQVLGALLTETELASLDIASTPAWPAPAAAFSGSPPGSRPCDLMAHAAQRHRPETDPRPPPQTASPALAGTR